mgnify:CR=1 FL=1
MSALAYLGPEGTFTQMALDDWDPAKDAAAGPQLFWRSVLCNLLVCLALLFLVTVRIDYRFWRRLAPLRRPTSSTRRSGPSGGSPSTATTTRMA